MLNGVFYQVFLKKILHILIRFTNALCSVNNATVNSCGLQVW